MPYATVTQVRKTRTESVQRLYGNLTTSEKEHNDWTYWAPKRSGTNRNVQSRGMFDKVKVLIGERIKIVTVKTKHLVPSKVPVPRDPPPKAPLKPKKPYKGKNPRPPVAKAIGPKKPVPIPRPKREKKQKFVIKRSTIIRRIPVYKTKYIPKVGSTLLVNDLDFSFISFKPYQQGVLRASRVGYPTYKDDYRLLSGDLVDGWHSSDCHWSTNLTGLPQPTQYAGNTKPTYADDAINAAISKITSKLYEKAKRQNLNALQVFAERRQTASMIAELVPKLVRSLIDLKKGNLGSVFTDWAGSPKTLGNTHLAYQFGVKPLVGDINGLVTHLKEERRADTFVIKVSTRGRTPAQVTPYGGSVAATFTYAGNVTRYIDWTVKLQATVRIKDKILDELSRLGLLNLPSVAWELVPYSFVVDWFIPIGDYLNTVDAFDSLEVVQCHRTVLMKETIGANFWARPGQIQGGEWLTVGDCRWGGFGERTWVTRTKIDLPSLPLPKINDEPFSLHRFGLAAALMSQRSR